MSAFAEKVVKARAALNLSQAQLAEKIGITARAVQTYELGDKFPRKTTLYKLASALEVSTKYLSDDDCTNPKCEIEKDAFLEEAQNRYGSNGVRDMETLLAESRAMFAGGEVSDEQKEEFFWAISEAYYQCREEAKRRFGRNRGRNDDR